MNNMLKSRPMLLLVVTLSLVVVALVSFWLAALPTRMLASLEHGLNTRHGMVLEASNPKLSFSNGVALQLENVSLERKSENSLSLSAQNMRIETSIASLFGASVSTQIVVLQKAVVAVDVSTASGLGLPINSSINFEDSSLRLRDGVRNSVITLGDANGTLSTAADGSGKASFTFLLADRLTKFTADFENAARLSTDGSPADVVLSDKNMVMAFSGRAKLGQGLELVGQNSIEAQDAAMFFRWIGLPSKVLEGVGPLSLTGGLSLQGLQARFQKLSGKIGATDISGTVQVAAVTDRTEITGELDVSRIALFVPKPDKVAQSWREEPFSAKDLLAAQFGLKVKVAALELRGNNIGPVAFTVATEGARTSITIDEQAMAGGTVAGQMAFEARQDELDVTASLDAKAADAGLFLEPLFDLVNVSGPVDVTASLKAQGGSAAALVSTLSGELAVTGKDLKLRNIALPLLLSKPGTGWNADEKHPPLPLQLDFDAQINEGVMTLRNATVQSTAISLKPKGEIDLLRQAFDVRLFPQGKGIDPKLTLTNPWYEPVFSTATTVKDNAAVTPPAN